jgi:predicted ArsR family transcriptional regulator
VKGVRQHILNILKERGQATVVELANGLDLAPVSVRHHLDILRRQGVIRAEGVERRKTRGRPRHIYVLTQEANSYFPDNYEELAGALLREMKENLPAEQISAFFHRLVSEYTRDLPIKQAQSTEDRLDLATSFLSQKGYLARWEHGDAGAYVLHVSNCPFAGLSVAHPELCDMDMLLVSRLTMSTPRRIAHSANGDHCCTYVLG